MSHGRNESVTARNIGGKRTGCSALSRNRRFSCPHPKSRKRKRDGYGDYLLEAVIQPIVVSARLDIYSSLPRKQKNHVVSEALRPDHRPYPYFPVFFTSLFCCYLGQCLAVVCGGRVLLFDGPTGGGGFTHPLGIGHCLYTIYTRKRG